MCDAGGAAWSFCGGSCQTDYSFTGGLCQTRSGRSSARYGVREEVARLCPYTPTFDPLRSRQPGC